MKRIFNYTVIIVLLSFGFIACESQPSDDDIVGRYIDIEIEGIEDGKMISLFAFQDKEEVLIDSSAVLEGKVRLETTTKELRFYYILVDQAEETPIVIFLDEDCESVSISATMPKMAENYQISGSQYSQDFKDYQDFSYQYIKSKTDAYNEIRAIGTSDSMRVIALIGTLDSLNDITQSYARNYIETQPESPVSWMMLNEFYPTTGLEGFDLSTLDYFTTVSEAMAKKYPYSEYPGMIEQDGLAIKNQIEMMMAEAQGLTLGDATGEASAPEIELMNPDGKLITLSSLRGQVVLIDFWASWCGPCRGENPNVVANYEKFKDQGFTVYSVSLDTDKAAWQKAIKADNLSWPNHVSDLQGWSSPAAAAYQVQSIPASFLIDENGVIIGQNLRGPALEQKLLEVFSK